MSDRKWRLPTPGADSVGSARGPEVYFQMRSK